MDDLTERIRKVEERLLERVIELQQSLEKRLTHLQRSVEELTQMVQRQEQPLDVMERHVHDVHSAAMRFGLGRMFPPDRLLSIERRT
jgi:phage shock protein A